MDTPKVPEPQNPRVVNPPRPTPQPPVVEKSATIQDAQRAQQINTPVSGGHPAPVMTTRPAPYMASPADTAPGAADPGIWTVPGMLRALGDLLTTVNRLPMGPGMFGAEILMLQNRLSTPGFNPTPADMDTLRLQVEDLAKRIGDLDRPVVNPLWVTEADIDQRLADVTATANRLHTGRETYLNQIQDIKRRRAAMMTPYSQPNLDVLNTDVLEFAKRVEAEAGRQGV